MYTVAGVLLLFLFFNINFRHQASQRPPVDPAPWRADYTAPIKTPLWPDPVTTVTPTSPPFSNLHEPDSAESLPPSVQSAEPASTIDPAAHGPEHSTLASSDDLIREEDRPSTTNAPHPIESLISAANYTFNGLLSRQSTRVEEAAKAYREKRGRHPPPGFEKWVQYSLKHDAIIVEDFWDQIYHDLEPFWAIPPAQIRAQARELGMAVIVKNGQTERNFEFFWHTIWEKMVKEISFMLPDLLMPCNQMDESRILVPWDTINEYVRTATKHKTMPPASEVQQTVQGWGEEGEKGVPVHWHTHPPYSFGREACGPETPIREDYKVLNSGTVDVADARNATSTYSYEGFVSNHSMSQDFCQDPGIAAFHAALTSPLSSRVTTTLQPMFGGSKLSVNNEILIPAPMYWNGEQLFGMDDKTPWSKKLDRLIWRGTATGGRHNALNWPHFQRYRFVALSNGTKYALADQTHDRIFTPAQQHAGVGPLPRPIRTNLEQWLNKRVDVALTDNFCDIPSPNGGCWYTDSEYKIHDLIPLKQQYKHKYLPDLDGNSFSGRYRSFLESSGVPIKATLYREWHDSRLVAWKHFVPMNNRFTDFYAILAYFMGCDEDICGRDGVVPGHDAQAEAIALEGSKWAKKVLRKVDMQIYMARLLLEWGRVTDDNRENVGWVSDILEDTPPPV